MAIGWRLAAAAAYRHRLSLMWRRYDRELITTFRPLFNCILVLVGLLTMAVMLCKLTVKSPLVSTTIAQQDGVNSYHHQHLNSSATATTKANIVILSQIFDSDGNDSDQRIFFHETSGRLELSFRQNCAIESAALHNPQRLVIQIFFQPQVKEMSIDQLSACFRALSRYDNVQVIVIDDEELYFKDSPLEDWYRKGEWRNYRAQHMSDYIRMVTMKKGGGGIYLDLDIVTLKSCDCLLFRNFVTTRDVKRITNAVFHLDRDHRLIDAIVKKQSEDYDRDNYVYNGPEVFTLVITDLCLKGKTNVCTNLRMLRPQNFHPKGATSDAMKEVFE